METLNDKLIRLVGKNENPDDWYLHPSGGGLVHKSVWISKNFKGIIANDAVIKWGKIYGGKIYGGKIYGGEIRNGKIYGGEIYGGKIYGGEIHGGRIYGGEIRGGIWKNKPYLVKKNKYEMCIPEPGKIKIGCLTHTFDYWLKNYRKIGKEHGISEEEIKKYKKYIDQYIERYGHGNSK